MEHIVSDMFGKYNLPHGVTFECMNEQRRGKQDIFFSSIRKHWGYFPTIRYIFPLLAAIMVPRAKYSLAKQRLSKKSHFPGQSDCFRVGHMSQFAKSGGSYRHLFFHD